MYNVLLVEDNKETREILELFLRKTGSYNVTVAPDGEAALWLTSEKSFDVILMDIMLPGMDGIDLCGKLRKNLYCPIIFISCLDDEETILRAFRMGGDDYITKPFRYPVLAAHMEAVLRRIRQNETATVGDVQIGNARLCAKEHAIYRNGTMTVLSPIEFDLLNYLIAHPDTVLGFENIYVNVWKQPSCGGMRTVYTHMRNLRKKIEDDPSNPKHLLTIPRDGYIFRLKG